MRTRRDFCGIFEALPGMVLLLAPDEPRYTIVAVSRAYARAIHVQSGHFVGRRLFEALPASGPDSTEVEDLRGALDAVVRTRASGGTPLHRSRCDGRWWRTMNAPVLGERGELQYIIHQAEDVTELVGRERAETVAREAELRGAFQLRLGDALRALASPREVQRTACLMLGEHLGVNRVHFAELEGEELVIRASFSRGVRPFPVAGPVATFGAGILQSYRRDRTVAVADVEHDARLTPAERDLLRASGTAAFAGAMLSRDGRSVAILGVHSKTARRWTPADVATIGDVADRVWTAAQRAEAEAELRESEARYAAIFERSPVGKALSRWSDRVIVSANPAFVRIFELTLEQVLGKTCVDLGIFSSAARGRLQSLLEAGDFVRDLECPGFASSGAARILSLNLDWVSINGEKHVLTTVRDMTELRRAEATARVQERERLMEQARTEALRRSEAKYSGILETSADAIVSVDDQQRITLFNRAAEEVFGYTRREAMGAPLDRLISEGMPGAQSQQVASGAAGDQVGRALSERSGRLVARRKGGEEFPADAAVSKVNIDGRTLLTVSLRDATARVRHDVEQRLLSELGSALASRIEEDVALSALTQLTVREFADLSTFYLVGEDGSVQRHGVACRDPAREELKDVIMGLPIDRRADHPLWKVLRTRTSQLVSLEHGFASLALGDEYRRVLEILSPRSVIGVPLLVGDRLLGALLVVACRPSRPFDAQDVALVEQVARRVALSLENARLYHATQRAIRGRDEVLGIVAHDLRSPLGTISMNASVIRAWEQHPERQCRRPVEAIERSASHMSRLINDLLDVTAMESGHLELARGGVAPGELVGEVIESHRDRAAAASIELHAQAPAGLPEAWADRGRLLQVFDNLLGNAIRVTAGGGVSVGAGRRAGELLFWVADTGPGIAPEDLPHLFDRFWQAHKTRRGAAGLGLSIVKLIVEAHGGRVWFESRVGGGTTAFFTVPLAAWAQVAASPPAPLG
jgi:PAS domain S-box-containing protein